MTDLLPKAEKHLAKLCVKIKNRCVGSQGNLEATAYFEEQLQNKGWNTERQSFDAFDWNAEDAKLEIDGSSIDVHISPYSLGCDVVGELVLASSLEELEKTDSSNKILCITGELTKESLMPKNFVFYNPDHHQKLVSLLEKSGAKAIVCIVNQAGVHEGGEYPFPILEDGDFPIPSVFLAEEEGNDLLTWAGSQAHLLSIASRRPSKGYNIIGTKGNESAKKITITAHIDSKKGTPGAIDNATGVTSLLLVSELLKEYDGPFQIELVALNGEDYYSVPGQMTYIAKNQGKFEQVSLNINIDGAGLKEGKTSFSFFNLPPQMETIAQQLVKKYPGITEGDPWVQGDHSIFLQFGVPAIAISSKWLIDNLASQNITHTPKDTPEIVSLEKLQELAEAIRDLILEMESC